MSNKCEQCNTAFESKAVHQMFCGDRCRKAYNRRVQRARRKLEKDGLRVQTLRSGPDKGRFWVIEARTNWLSCGENGLNIEELESWAADDTAFVSETRKFSASEQPEVYSNRAC